MSKSHGEACFIVKRNALHLYSIFRFSEGIINLPTKFLQYLLANWASGIVTAGELFL